MAAGPELINAIISADGRDAAVGRLIPIEIEATMATPLCQAA